LLRAFATDANPLATSPATFDSADSLAKRPDDGVHSNERTDIQLTAQGPHLGYDRNFTLATVGSASRAPSVRICGKRARLL